MGATGIKQPFKQTVGKILERKSSNEHNLPSVHLTEGITILR
jgi:hypothetical protein